MTIIPVTGAVLLLAGLDVFTSVGHKFQQATAFGLPSTICRIP
jgi:hypothetical protein